MDENDITRKDGIMAIKAFKHQVSSTDQYKLGREIKISP